MTEKQKKEFNLYSKAVTIVAVGIINNSKDTLEAIARGRDIYEFSANTINNFTPLFFQDFKKFVEDNEHLEEEEFRMLDYTDRFEKVSNYIIERLLDLSSDIESFEPNEQLVAEIKLGFLELIKHKIFESRKNI